MRAVPLAALLLLGCSQALDLEAPTDAAKGTARMMVLS